MEKKLMYQIFPNLLAKAINDNTEKIKALKIYVDEQDASLGARIDNLADFLTREIEALADRMTNAEDDIIHLQDVDTSTLELISAIQKKVKAIQDKYAEEIPSIKAYVERNLQKAIYTAKLPAGGIKFNSIPGGGNSLFAYQLPEDGVYMTQCDFSSECQKEYLMEVNISVGAQVNGAQRIYNFPNYPSAESGVITGVFNATAGTQLTVGVNLWHATSVVFGDTDTVDGNTTLRIWRLN